jgi:hypothetical protein
MDFYTLTKSFIPREIVGEFVSAVWTERYSSAGDVELVTPATPSMVRKLTPGTFLGLRGTKEIMMLDTQSIENDLLTTSGVSLPKFLDERVAWFSNPDTSGTGLFAEYTSDTLTAGQLISSAVEKMVANPVIFPPTFINIKRPTSWFVLLQRWIRLRTSKSLLLNRSTKTSFTCSTTTK